MPIRIREITCSSQTMALRRLAAEGFTRVGKQWMKGNDRSARLEQMPSGRVMIIEMGYSA